MMRIRSFVFNPLEENTYVLFDETKECVIIDPGCYDAAEQEELTNFIQQEQLNVRLLLNTHGHVDHVLGNYFVKEKYKVRLMNHREDVATLKAVKVYAAVGYGFHRYQETEADGHFEDGDILRFGNQELRVLFVPGHAPGHVAFYHEQSKTVIGGDVLFYNSIGRTDLPGGNFDTLMQSIRNKFFTLPDDITVYPGHGPETTIGFEKRTNPFCAVSKVNH